jgi:hypothetical protein
MKYLSLLLFSCAVSSCVLYQPNAINTPHLNGKGDLDITALYQTGRDINLNSSYAISDSIFVFANLSWMDNDQIGVWDSYTHKHLFMDIGFGKDFHRPFPNRYLNLSGGIGYGSANNSELPYYHGGCYPTYAESNFAKTFLQFNTGSANKKNTIIIGLASRLTYVYNYNLKLENPSISTTEPLNHVFLVEQGVYLAVGIPNFKIYYQLVLSYHPSNLYNLSENKNNSSGVNGIGLLFDLKNDKVKKS